MIFVTLGSQKFQFNRLLQKIDELIEQGVIKEEVLAQSGYSDYQANNFRCIDFMNRDEFATYMGQADMVITHAGTGAIIGAVKQDKKVVAVPRQKDFGEHVDDHQFQIVEQFEELGIIEPCYKVEDLQVAYQTAITKEYKKYVSNTQTIVDDILSFLEK